MHVLCLLDFVNNDNNKDVQSIFGQAMACCLAYEAIAWTNTDLWPVTSRVHWHSSEGNFTSVTSAMND